ncbi:MAG: hypothetical protein WBW48_06985 [Anaerolineae bacterium]
METLRLTQKVRPIRILFLVSESDEDQVESAFRLNTALWGGMLNPVVSLEQDNDVLESTFRASHADFGINLSGEPWPVSMARTYDRRLKPLEGYNGLIEQDEEGVYSFRLGCDMRPIYADFWEKRGRYYALSKDTSRDDFVLLEGADDYWQKYALLVAGAYPDGFGYDYTGSYCKVTACNRVVLDDEASESLGSYMPITPLSFTLSKIRCYYPTSWRDFSSHIIFIGEMEEVRHWLEFWNLRSLGKRVLFLPWDKVPLFVNRMGQYLQEGSYPISDQVENRTLLQKASTLSRDCFEEAIESIRDLIPDMSSLAIRAWIPRFGVAFPPKMGQSHGPPPLESPICVAYEQEDLVHLADNRIEFKLALPQFLIPFKDDSDRSWSIALSGREPSESDIWINYPPFHSLSRMLRDEAYLMFRNFKLCARENLVIFRDRRLVSDFFSMSLPNSFQVFKAVLSEFGLTVSDYSEKGRYAASIESAIGGFFGSVMLLRDRGVRELLQRLSANEGRCHLPRGNLERIVAEESQLIQERASQGDKISPASIVDELIGKRVLRSGLVFKCKHCYRKGWYDLSQCGDTFVCHYCFEKQQTPVLDKKRWHYKASGLFGTQDVGYGSLPVVCTSLFFRLRFMDVRHIYSFEFSDQDGNSGEIDLAFIRMGFHEEPEIAICECKSSSFSKDDFDKLEKMAVSIPGSVVCAATLKEAFSDDERNWANELWSAGHKVILLARADLESSEIDLEEEVEDRFRYFSDFTGLAYSTRAKYLGYGH